MRAAVRYDFATTRSATSTANTFPTGSWIHVAVTADETVTDSGTVNFYVNGALDATVNNVWSVAGPMIYSHAYSLDWQAITTEVKYVPFTEGE